MIIFSCIIHLIFLWGRVMFRSFFKNTKFFVLFVLPVLVCAAGVLCYPKQPVHIFMICDEKYAPYTATAIQSIEKNKSFFTKNYFYIAVPDDVEKVKLYFNENLTKNITFISIAEFFKDKYSETFLNAYNTRFFAPELFPDLDKILYLDSDILVFKDLSALYEQDIQNVYAGVVSDYPTSVTRRKDVLGLKTYFNAGVMVLNLKKMRQDKILEKLIQNYVFLDKENKLFWADQDVLNYTFKDHVKFLSEKYNQQGIALTEDKALNMHILHYTSYKPWGNKMVPFFMEYWDIFKKTHLSHYRQTQDKTVFDKHYIKVNEYLGK